MTGWPPPALVLCAGLGTRLRPLTEYRAKPAMPVGAETLIGRILRNLASSGITDAVLNLHHLPQTVTREVGDGSQYGLRVRYSWEQPRVLGSAGGPRHALPLLEGETILVVNGDTLCDLPLRALWERHRDAGALVTLGLMPHPEPGRYGGVTLDVDLPASTGTRDARPDGGERTGGTVPVPGSRPLAASFSAGSASSRRRSGPGYRSPSSSTGPSRRTTRRGCGRRVIFSRRRCWTTT